MILAVDAGNTQICLCCARDGRILSVARIETSLSKTEYEYAATISQILRINGEDGEEFEGAVVASVVPQITGTLKLAVRLVTGCDALVVGAGMKTGLNIGLSDPASLGADLVAAAVAALDRYRPPLVIIDMGTATTLTVINKDGRFLGGAIVPGVGISADALASSASLLPHIDIFAPDKCICANTEDAMRSGVVFGAAAALDGLLGRIEAELGSKVSCVATGGLAKKIIPLCRPGIDIDDDLLLRGLCLLWERNRFRR